MKAIITIFILGLAFIIIDVIISKPKPFYGVVVDKHYKAERNSTGTGYGMTGGGTNGVIITSEYESEKFFLMVKTERGEIVTVECEPEIYYSKEINQKIKCNAYIGFFTECVWSLKGIR